MIKKRYYICYSQDYVKIDSDNDFPLEKLTH